MLIRMTGQISGTRDGSPWPPPGTDLELPGDEAIALIAQGMATPATPAKETAAAAPDDTERATTTRRTRR